MTVEAPLVEGPRAEPGATLLWFARFDDLAVRAGLGGSTFPDFGGGAMVRSMQAWHHRQISVFIDGTSRRVGEGALGVLVAPLANLKAGAAAHEMALEIGGSPRRPLRAPATVEAHVLRPLVTPSKLFAFVSLDGSVEAAAVAAAAIARWGGRLAQRGPGRYQTALQGSEPGAPLKTGSRKSTGIFASKWWRDLSAALATVKVFSDAATWQAAQMRLHAAR